ncbi:MAG: DUF1850 domain-containing protein [Chloroflexi bacterium]|nr:DUF1850 domain-containing protein [Chloroflexota bacterium]
MKKLMALLAVVALSTGLVVFLAQRDQDDVPDNSLLLRVDKSGTGETLLSLPVSVGEEFDIRWIHSVSGSPIRDTYRIREDGEIVMTEYAYQWWAEPLHKESNSEVTVVSDGGWTRVVFEVERQFDPCLTLRLSTHDTHELIVGGSTIPLLDIAEAGDAVKFRVLTTGNGGRE